MLQLSQRPQQLQQLQWFRPPFGQIIDNTPELVNRQKLFSELAIPLRSGLARAVSYTLSRPKGAPTRDFRLRD